ncbi:uncharacterized protein [Montipora foliosa]|uniref:uncharacterized protein n=1 Tax=Montipora foliosa TaxID=591990 RepID=UPI0035F18BEF
MATWPQANQKRLDARNATLELQTGRDADSSGSQLNKSPHASFENLALSVDSQALSEISSFPTDSISTPQGERLQVSVISPSSATESMPRSDGNLTIGSVSIFIAFLLLVVGAVLVAVYKSKKNVHKNIIIASELLRAAGLFGFTGGVTNWLGIKLIFKKIPGVFFSGAVTKNFVATKKLLANFILESFFSTSQVKQYIDEKTSCYVNLDAIDDQLEKILNSARCTAMINEQLNFFMGTPEGLKLQMLGVTKAKLKPLVKPQLMKMKISMVPLLLSCIESIELLNADHLRVHIVDLISTRTHELSAQQVKHLVKDAVYRHLSWIVFWGSLLGAIIGCLAELASVFIRGPT